MPHLLPVVPLQIAALVRRRGHPIEVSDDTDPDGPEVGSLLQDVGDRVSSVRRADRPESVRGAIAVLHEPPTSGDDVFHVRPAEVVVAEASPRPAVASPAAVVRGEDREALRHEELGPNVPFVHGLRFWASVG